MSTNTPAGVESTGTDTDAQITGPHTEFDRTDRPTGATYYRCERCGEEALERTHIHDFGCEP